MRDWGTLADLIGCGSRGLGSYHPVSTKHNHGVGLSNSSRGMRLFLYRFHSTLLGIESLKLYRICGTWRSRMQICIDSRKSVSQAQVRQLRKPRQKWSGIRCSRLLQIHPSFLLDYLYKWIHAASIRHLILFNCISTTISTISTPL